METTPSTGSNAPGQPEVLPSSSDEIVLVLTTLPAETDIRGFLQPLLESRLIACASVLAPVRSMYRWDGVMVESVEQQVLLKTTATCLARLRENTLARHPYEVPEWLVVPVTDGLPAYLSWVRAETSAP